MIKRIIFVMAAALLGLTMVAQESRTRLESNFQLGSGLFMESGYLADEQNPGLVLRLSYGLDIPFNENWSMMPGVGYRAQLGDIRHFMWQGNDPDGMTLADVFVIARFHYQETDGSRFVIGFGPALSYMVSPDTYYIDADLSDPVNGKEKFKRYDLNLLPSVTFLRGMHFQWGVEANIGLLNAMRQYPEYNRNGSIHLHYLALTCGWHF